MRIGLPQLKDMQQHTKFLQMPISSTEPLSNSSGPVSFEFNTEDGIQVLMDGTNDPMWKNNDAVLGKKDIFTITANSLVHLNKETEQRTLDLKVCDDYAKYLHEGYWYDLSFSFMQKMAQLAPMLRAVRVLPSSASMWCRSLLPGLLQPMAV